MSLFFSRTLNSNKNIIFRNFSNNFVGKEILILKRKPFFDMLRINFLGPPKANHPRPGNPSKLINRHLANPNPPNPQS
jgi:hypothetical protein